MIRQDGNFGGQVILVAQWAFLGREEDDLNDPGFHEVSYERSRWPKRRSVKSKKKLCRFILAIIDCGSGFQPRLPG
jgi:hypothetical protein